jgi:hypothetical protein
MRRVRVELTYTPTGVIPAEVQRSVTKSGDLLG